MTEEDEAFNEIERQAKQRKESVKAQLDKLESQEPVAWIHNFIEGGISIGRQPSDLDRHPDRWTALYKDSKPCPTCEALCRTVMLDQTSHDTTPLERTWVGLTRDEQSFVYSSLHSATSRKDSFWVDFANAIEDRLKEKNT